MSKYIEMLSPQAEEPAKNKYTELLGGNHANQSPPAANHGPKQGGTMTESVASKAEPSAWQRFKDVFTGNLRETESSKRLPELAFSGLLNTESMLDVMKISPALITSIDPEEQANIVQSNFPHIERHQDNKGNIVLRNSKSGVTAMINKPGFSPTDGLQTAALTAEFAQGGKLASGGGGKIKKAAKAAGGVGFVETVNQGLQSQAGGEFNPEDVAIAAGGAAVLEPVFLGLANAFPIMRETVKTAGGKITDTIRESFKQEAIKQGRNADEITDDVIKEALFPDVAALEAEREFGINLTKGQRTGDQKQLRLEDDLRSGRTTDKAQAEMLKHQSEVQQQTREAATTIQQDLSREGATITSQQEAGALINQGVRNAESIANDAVRDSFESVGDAALKPEAFVRLFESTKNAIKGLDFPITSETPATNALLKQISSAQKLFNKKGVTLKPQHINRIEQIRRSIGAQIKTAANPTDKRNLVTMQKEYDNFLDDAVRDALFSGDQAALDSIKSSRSLFGEYASKFRANSKKTRSGATIKDKEGAVIETIIEGNPTDIQTVNALFGAGNTFGNAASKNMAARFKSILGADSPEWGVVRQAAFKRLVRTGTDGKTISGQQTLKAVNQAIEKNSELMKELFTSQEIGLIRRFATQVKRAQPDINKGSANPSGTAAALINGLRENMGNITQSLGLASGSPVMFVAGKGFQMVSGRAANKAANDAVRPFGAIIDARPGLVGAGTAGTVQLSN